MLKNAKKLLLWLGFISTLSVEGRAPYTYLPEDFLPVNLFKPTPHFSASGKKVIFKKIRELEIFLRKYAGYILEIRVPAWNLFYREGINPLKNYPPRKFICNTITNRESKILNNIILELVKLVQNYNPGEWELKLTFFNNKGIPYDQRFYNFSS